MLPSVLESDGINPFDRLCTYVNCALLSLNAKYLSISVIILYQCPTVYVEGEEYERERAIYETSNYVHRPREVSVYQAVYWFELHKAREGRFICQVVYRS